MRDGFFVIDGDGHVHETVDGGEALRKHMDPGFRSRPFGGGWVDRSWRERSAVLSSAGQDRDTCLIGAGVTEGL